MREFQLCFSRKTIKPCKRPMIDDSYDVCKKSSSNGIKTIYFRDKEMKVLEQNENLKEVSNWGEIYRYIKEMQSK